MSSKQHTTLGVKSLEFANCSIRLTPDRRVVVVDILKAIGQKDPKNSWKHLKRQYPELVEDSSTYSTGRGRPAETLSEKGILRLMMVVKGPRASEFREWASDILLRYLQGDIGIADDVIQRNRNPKDLEWLKKRLEGIHARNQFTSCIASHGGEGEIYREVTEDTNRSVVGMTAREIKASRKVKKTRDGLTIEELTRVQYIEMASSKAIDNRNARGNLEIASTHHKIVELENEFWTKVRAL